MIKAGEVALLRFQFSDPPKIKICLCFCIERGFFFIISTKPYRWAPPDSQVTIFKEELACLDHDSYLDTSKAYEFDPHVIAKGVQRGVYPLAPSALCRIKNALSSQRYLPEDQRIKAISNL